MIRRRAKQLDASVQTEDGQLAPLKGFDDFPVSLGDIMRAERATLGKSLLDVQSALKIKISQITAIENCDPSAFDTPAFIPGHVRSYARFLGLEPEWALTKFCQEGNYSIENRLGPEASGLVLRKSKSVNFAVRKDALVKRSDTPYFRKPEGLLSKADPPAIFSSIVLGALIVAIGYGGWAILQELQRVQLVQTDQVADSSILVEPLALAGSLAPDETDNIADSPPRDEALDRLYRRPQALEVPIVSPRDPPIVTLDPDQVATVSELKIPEPVQDGLSVEEQETFPEAPPVQVVEEEVDESVREVILLAVRPSWVRIRSEDGSVLLEKILDGGERYVVPEMEQAPILRTGNAGSVYFLVNGETYGPLGEGPTVIDDIVMGPKEVAASFEVADLESDSQLAKFAAMASAPDKPSDGTP